MSTERNRNIKMRKGRNLKRVKYQLKSLEEAFERDATARHKNISVRYALIIAQKYVDKQIAKKPILKNGESRSFVDYEDGHGEYKVTEWQDWVCPICGWFVGQRYNWSRNHSHDQRKCNYCNECGQKLDWSDT